MEDMNADVIEELLDAFSGEWEFVGNVAVDTATLALVDPVNGAEVEKFDYEDFGQVSNEQGYPFAVIIHPTGFGDGFYPVEIRRGVDGRVAEVRIRFME